MKRSHTFSIGHSLKQSSICLYSKRAFSPFQEETRSSTSSEENPLSLYKIPRPDPRHHPSTSAPISNDGTTQLALPASKLATNASPSRSKTASFLPGRGSWVLGPPHPTSMWLRPNEAPDTCPLAPVRLWRRTYVMHENREVYSMTPTPSTHHNTHARARGHSSTKSSHRQRPS